MLADVINRAKNSSLFIYKTVNYLCVSIHFKLVRLIIDIKKSWLILGATTCEPLFCKGLTSFFELSNVSNSLFY